MNELQERLERIRASATDLEALGQAVALSAGKLLEEKIKVEQDFKKSLAEWFPASQTATQRKFQRRSAVGVYYRLRPAGPILNSGMVQELLADGKIFVHNVNSGSMFFIKGTEEVRYVD